LAGGIELDPYPYADPFPGLDIVLNTDRVDANAGEPCPPLEWVVDPPEALEGGPSPLGSRATLQVEGREVKADVLEGGALRVSGAARSASDGAHDPDHQEVT
jgi:hypothetical protein